MNVNPRTELEMSPYVIEYWKNMGFCVHGEVAIHGNSNFVDHVAHLGPCMDPTYVVAIEMKKGASRSLRQQVRDLDGKHVADEIWGVVTSTPREATLKQWSDLTPRWICAGLHKVSAAGVEELQPSRVLLRKNHKQYFKRRYRDLLLVPENRDTHGGYPSGVSTYVTHWSWCKAYLLERAKLDQIFTVEDMCVDLPYPFSCYKNPKNTVRALLHFHMKAGSIVLNGKVGRRNQYAWFEPDPTK